MKKILVPTDFSANAENALAFALSIGKKFGSDIVMLHTYHVNQSPLVFKDLAGILRREAEEKMKETVTRFKEEPAGSLSLDGQVLMGSPKEITTKCADQKECSLIVMGTQGATGALEVFIGSVTGAVLKHSQRPILAIPSGSTYQPFKNIVLALDNLPLPSREVFKPLSRLAAAFGAHLSVFNLKTEEAKGIDRKIEDYLEGIEVSYHELTDPNQDVYEHINDFVKATNADLLCMVRRKKGFFQSLFKGSATLKQVYNSPVPLLVLIDER